MIDIETAGAWESANAGVKAACNGRKCRDTGGLPPVNRLEGILRRETIRGGAATGAGEPRGAKADDT